MTPHRTVCSSRLFGKRSRVSLRSIDQADDGGGLEGLPDDAEAVDLDAAARADPTGLREEPAVRASKRVAVVADEASEAARLAGRGRSLARQGRLAGARAAPDQDARLAEDDAAGMDGLDASGSPLRLARRPSPGLFLS